MINFGWNSASILGVFLAVAGAGLYFLRSIKPELSRDYDIFFSAVGLVCGGILIAYGWKFDPLMQLGQFLLTLATFFFAFETLRLRGLATEQALAAVPLVPARIAALHRRDRPAAAAPPVKPRPAVIILPMSLVMMPGKTSGKQQTALMNRGPVGGPRRVVPVRTQDAIANGHVVTVRHGRRHSTRTKNPRPTWTTWTMTKS